MFTAYAWANAKSNVNQGAEKVVQKLWPNIWRGFTNHCRGARKLALCQGYAKGSIWKKKQKIKLTFSVYRWTVCQTERRIMIKVVQLTLLGDFFSFILVLTQLHCKIYFLLSPLTCALVKNNCSSNWGNLLTSTGDNFYHHSYLQVILFHSETYVLKHPSPITYLTTKEEN